MCTDGGTQKVLENPQGGRGQNRNTWFMDNPLYRLTKCGSSLRMYILTPYFSNSNIDTIM